MTRLRGRLLWPLVGLVLVGALVGFWLRAQGPSVTRETTLVSAGDTSPLVAPAVAPGTSGVLAYASRNAPGLTVRLADGTSWQAYAGKLGEFYYAWSPDGRYLAFRAEMDPDRMPRALALVVADLETRKVEQVSDFLPGLGRPSWRASRGRLEVYAPLAPAGMVRRTYPVDAPAGTPSLLVYERDGEIWVEAEGEEPRQVSRGGGYAPLLSPDATRVLYSWADGIYVASLSDSPSLGRNPVAAGVSPCWSPEGTHIAYCHIVDLGHEGEGERADIYLLDIRSPGAVPLQVTHTPEELEVELAWPKPDRLVYAVRNDGSIREAIITR